MAKQFNFPTNPQQIHNEAAIIVKSFALQNLKTAFFNLPESKGTSPVLYKSQLGTSVFSNLDISAGSYTIKGQNFSFDAMKIDTVLFTPMIEKDIIKTGVQGHPGTVKEYISDKDWTVNMKGVLIGNNQLFPMDDFINLKKICLAPIPLAVNSWFLNNLGIYNLVVTTASFPQLPGGISQQPFEINCLSDLPFIFKVTK